MNGLTSRPCKNAVRAPGIFSLITIQFNINAPPITTPTAADDCALSTKILYKDLKESDILKKIKERIQDLDINFRVIIQDYLNDEIEKIKEELLEKNQTKDFENIEEIEEDIFDFCVDLSDIIDNQILEL